MPVAHFRSWLMVAHGCEPIMVTWEWHSPMTAATRDIITSIRTAAPIDEAFVAQTYRVAAEDFAAYGMVPVQFVTMHRNIVNMVLVQNFTSDDLPKLVAQIRAKSAGASQCAFMTQVIHRDLRTDERHEGVEVYLASPDRRERWWLPIEDHELGAPVRLEFSPGHKVFDFFPLPY
jgi:hypothetical protein